MGVLCYLGVLIVIPLLLSKDDAFVKYHLKQGLALVLVEILIWMSTALLWPLFLLWKLLDLGTFVLAIIGILHVYNNKEEPLPLIGGFANHLTF